MCWHTNSFFSFLFLLLNVPVTDGWIPSSVGSTNTPHTSRYGCIAQGCCLPLWGFLIYCGVGSPTSGISKLPPPTELAHPFKQTLILCCPQLIAGSTWILQVVPFIHSSEAHWGACGPEWSYQKVHATCNDFFFVVVVAMCQTKFYAKHE